MTTQPEVLRLADIVGEQRFAERTGNNYGKEAAAELRRLHALNAELLEALSDIAHGLESARIWGGMEWTYNPLHPVKYLPLRDKARAAIAKLQGEQT